MKKRFAIAADAALLLAKNAAEVPDSHALVAPTLLRSQVLARLYSAVRNGDLDKREADDQLDYLRGLRIDCSATACCSGTRGTSPANSNGRIPIVPNTSPSRSSKRTHWLLWTLILPRRRSPSSALPRWRICSQRSREYGDRRQQGGCFRRKAVMLSCQRTSGATFHETCLAQRFSSAMKPSQTDSDRCDGDSRFRSISLRRKRYPTISATIFPTSAKTGLISETGALACVR